MSATHQDGSGALTLSLERLVDAQCQHFEKAWKTAADEPPRLEAYLDNVPEQARSALLVELIPLDVHYRVRRGEAPPPEAYIERFPHLERRRLDEAFAMGAAPVETVPRDRVTVRGGPDAESVTLPGYEILAELGRGGMGIVYRARQLRLNRIVAVKMILARGHADQRALARHRQEAQAAAQLQHPHIVQIYEVGEHAGRPFLALEFVPGGSLEKQLNGQPQPAYAAAQFVATLAGAVHYAHQRGVVHRDLKPGNVLLASSEHFSSMEVHDPASARTASAVQTALTARHASLPLPKITDFGLAKLLSDEGEGLTLSGDVLGTPSYMAPEQAAGKPDTANPAVDVYGLGALLYEMLTGRPPFRGESPIETVLQVRHQDPVSPSRLVPNCPRDLVTICLKCLHKEPARRYLTAAALEEDLQRFREGRPILARPVGHWEQAAKWAQRRPAIAALAACLTVVTALGLVAVLGQWRRAERERVEAVNARNDESEARRQAQTRLYASQIALAYSEFTASRLQSANQILELYRQQAPEQCLWEWHYLKQQCRTQLLTLAGHTQEINWLTYSSDLRWLASCGGRFNGIEPGEVKVWDAHTGKLVHDLRGPTKAVYRVAFHPDGAWLAACCLDGKVWRWDLGAGTQLTNLEHGSPIHALAFSPDGQQLAIADTGGRVRTWDLESLETKTYLDHTGNLFDVAYSPDGKYLASAGRDAAVVLRDAHNGEPLHWLYHPSDARRLTFSPDGRLLVSAAFDGTVRFWDLAARPVALLTHHLGIANVFNLAFCPDGQRLACCIRNGDVRVWRTRGQQDALVANAVGGTEQVGVRQVSRGTLCLFVLGIVLGLFFSFKGLETAAKNHLRLWIDGQVFQPKDLGQASNFGRGNRMIVILLATGVSFSACLAFIIYATFGRGQNLFDPKSMSFWSTAFLVAWPLLFLVCCQRIIARRPEECWEVLPPWEWRNAEKVER